MYVAILGELEVRRDESTYPIAGTRLRVLLVALALSPGRPVAPHALSYALWGEDAPSESGNALQSLVSRLRRALGSSDVITQGPAGYTLHVRPEQVDAELFAAGVAQARRRLSEDPAAALETLEVALDLWRGAEPAEADSFPAAARRLNEQRLEAQGMRIDAILRLGRALDVIAELESLVEHYPLREQFALQLLTALDRASRRAEALARYEAIRGHLADELGTDPSPALRALHLRLLQDEPIPAPTGEPPAPVPRAQRGNLRAPLSSFIGREDELARVSSLLGASRLVSLVGPGGAGKTRLASEAARQLLGSTRDGVWLTELASINDGADVAQTVMDSLGFRDSLILDAAVRAALNARETRTQLLERLADAQVLLILDNCEHVIGAVADLVDVLLARCPGVTVLATSREPLGIIGESLLVVPSLEQPREAADATEAQGYHAIELLVERATSVQPGFVLDADTVVPAIEIVRRLDGQPLAIELAAARLRSMSIHEVASRLSDRFSLLTGGSRTALPRHRTLRAVVEWSWDLLSDPERILCERLAVFPAGVTLESAEAVASGGVVAVTDVLDLLSSLVEKSLLQRTGTAGSRYRMLETIREYGLEQLGRRGELRKLYDRHAAYFADFMQRSRPELHGRDQLLWLARLSDERDNLLAALRTFVDRGQAQEAGNLAVASGEYWLLVGSNREVATWANYALAASGEMTPATRAMARAMQAIGTLSTDSSSAADLHDGMQNLGAIIEELAVVDPNAEPAVSFVRPVLAMLSGDVPLMHSLVEQALKLPDPWTRAAVRVFRGFIAENEGDVEQMRRDGEIALAEFRRLGERWGMSNALRVMAMVHTFEGDIDAAIAHYEEAIAIEYELGSEQDIVMHRVRLADLHQRQGNWEQARKEILMAKRDTERAGLVMEALFIDTVLIEVTCAEGDITGALRQRDDVVRRLDEIPSLHPIYDHARAMVLAMSVGVDLLLGDVPAAAQKARRGYVAGVRTKDMPIVASIGVAAARVAQALGRAEDSAEILGASARLRGSADATQLEIRRLTEALRAELGPAEFSRRYDSSRALDRDAALARLDPELFC